MAQFHLGASNLLGSKQISWVGQLDEWFFDTNVHRSHFHSTNPPPPRREGGATVLVLAGGLSELWWF